MEAGFFTQIIKNVFVIVAINAELTLCFPVGCIMALCAFLFVFFMRRGDFARHKQRLQGICINHRCYRKKKQK